jgi:D-sedoheptulose 7-phosphate isomerase
MRELIPHIAHEIQKGVGVNLQLARLATEQIAEVATIYSDTPSGGRQTACARQWRQCFGCATYSRGVRGALCTETAGPCCIALTTDQCALTAIGNDFGFEQIFSRQIEALGKCGDVVLAISKSGNSPNVLALLNQRETCV